MIHYALHTRGQHEWHVRRPEKPKMRVQVPPPAPTAERARLPAPDAATVCSSNTCFGRMGSVHPGTLQTAGGCATLCASNAPVTAANGRCGRAERPTAAPDRRADSPVKDRRGTTGTPHPPSVGLRCKPAQGRVFRALRPPQGEGKMGKDGEGSGPGPREGEQANLDNSILFAIY